MKALIAILLALALIGCCLAVLIFDPAWMTGNRQLVDYGEIGDKIPGGAGAPARGDCTNIGEVFPDNPFTGWPVQTDANWNRISAWWCDPSYFQSFGVQHWGIDIARVPGGSSIEGTGAVCTSYKAIVRRADFSGYPATRSNSGMGNFVELEALYCWPVCDEWDPLTGACIEQHEECAETGWRATYMHLMSVAVSPGDIVDRGDVIGQVDSTGNSTGHHLHYQITMPGVGAIDPAPSMDPSYTDALRSIVQGHR